MNKELSRRNFLKTTALMAAGVSTGVQGVFSHTAWSATAPRTIPITIWIDTEDAMRVFSNRFAEYAALHPEQAFEFDFVVKPYPDIVDQFISALVVGAGAPDIIGMENSWFPKLLKGDLAEQELYDLTPWLDAEGPGFQEQFRRWELYSWAGRTYGVETSLCPCVYYYRQDIFDRTGIDPNTFSTYQDFIRAGRQLKAETGSFMTLAETAHSAYPLLFLQQNDGGIFGANGEIILDSDRSIEALELYYDLTVTHQVAYSIPEIWGADLTALFQDGVIAGIIGADWFASILCQYAGEAQAGLWRVAKMPAFRPNERRTTVWGGMGMGITTQCRHADIAWQLLKHALLTNESQINNFLEAGYFPTMTESLNDPRLREKEIRYFGNQKTGEVFAEVAVDVPFIYTHPFKAEAFLIFNNQTLQPVMSGKQSPEKALRDAARNLRELIIRSKD